MFFRQQDMRLNRFGLYCFQAKKSFLTEATELTIQLDAVGLADRTTAVDMGRQGVLEERPGHS